MATRMMLRPPPIILAEHPFFFFLRQREPHITLFAGHFAQPDEQ